jgi:hypothetical protein
MKKNEEAINCRPVSEEEDSCASKEGFIKFSPPLIYLQSPKFIGSFLLMIAGL